MVSGAALGLFLFIALLQSALIHYHHFSPFERESNLKAMLWGARPAPRFWAVVVLDFCTGLLVALLVLSVLPRSANDDPLARLVRTLPAWVAVSLLVAAWHGHWNTTIIRFPNVQVIARRLVVELVLGVLLVALVLALVALAHRPDVLTALIAWSRMLPGLLPPAVLLAFCVFVVRGLASCLRAVPVIGAFLHAALSTGLVVLAIERYGAWMMGDSEQAAGFTGIEGMVIALSAAAMIALLVASRLPGAEPHADAVEPPPIVVKPSPSVAGDPPIGHARLTETGAVLESEQMRVEVMRAPFGIDVRDNRGETLWQLAPDGLERQWIPHTVLSIPLLYTGNTIKTKWRAVSKPVAQITRITVDAYAVRVGFRGAELDLTFHTPDVLRIEFRHTGMLPHTTLAFCSPSDAHYMGLGQRFNSIDQRGQEMYFLVEEGGVGYEWARKRLPMLYPLLKRLYGARGSFPNGEHCTGFPVPFALVARERGPSIGLFWDTYRLTWFKTGGRGTSPSYGEISVLDNHIDLYVCAGPTPLDVIRQYTALTGRSDAPPPWVFLPWKTRTGAVTEADVFEDIHRFRELDIPLAQVGIEHWQDVRGSYEFSQQWFPHIDDLIADAREHGDRVHIWHFPYMNAGAATHREGVRRGFFVRNRVGLPYQQRIFHGIATVVDYSNPAASSWHQGIVAQTFHRRGIQGVMTDYAESIPPDAVFYNGRSGLAMRNAYPVIYCQAMQQAARQVLGADYVIYPRAGYAGSQRFVNAQWPGDQDTDWDDGDGLPAAVRAMLNASICGFPVHGSDIGGWYDWYSPITTKELYLRWAEVGAHSPLMRAHGGPMGRNREPWKFDEETVQIYRALSQEHVKLFPYFYSLAKLASETGLPIIRHPALIWPDCAMLYEIEDAWMIGEALYVAPVVRQGATKRQVVLPPGEWWSFSQECAVQGPTRLMVDAPLGNPPRFMRRGYLLPRFVESFDTFDAASAARVGSLDGDLEVWLCRGDVPASFTLFDGTEVREANHQVGARRIHWRLFGNS